MLVKKILKLFPIFFYSALVVFLFIYLKSIDFDKFNTVQFDLSLLFTSGLIALTARFWQSNIWLAILKGLGAKDIEKSRRELLYVYAKSWMGRYIPGTAPWILGKIYFASKHGISKNKLAVSSLLEGALQIAVVMAVSFMMLMFDSRLDVIDINYKIIMITVLVGCVVSVYPPVFNKIISIIYKLFKKKVFDKEHYVNNKTIVKGATMYAVGALLSGLSLFFVAKSIYPSLDYSSVFFVMGTGNLAGVIGMLAIFAPSGIGVREGVQLALLSLIMPTELALLVTITTRLWGVVMDLVFFGIAKAQSHTQQ